MASRQRSLLPTKREVERLNKPSMLFYQHFYNY